MKRVLRYVSVFNEKIGYSEYPIFKGFIKLLLFCWAIRNIVQTKFIRPKERPYQTENLYAVLEKQRKLEKEVSAIAKGTKHSSRPRRG